VEGRKFFLGVVKRKQVGGDGLLGDKLGEIRGHGQGR